MAKHQVHQLLDTAEDTFREVVRTELPLFLDIPVVKADPNPKNPRHWMFYTDLSKIHMDVFKPDLVEKIFRDAILKMYTDAYGTQQQPNDELLRRLVHDNFTYLYFHELFHPAFCPDSKNDEKFVDEALYNGIKKAESHRQRPEILKKVGNARNAGCDQIIDTAFFYLANYGNDLETRLEQVLENSPVDLKQIKHLPDGVVPIFDVIEFEVHKDKFESLFYPLTRATYGLLFERKHNTREIIFDYFRNRLKKEMKEDEFDSAIKQALKGFISELTPEQLRFARINRQDYENTVEEFYRNYNNVQGDSAHEKVIQDITALLLDKKSRYSAIEGFIKPLAKYISLIKEEKRHGTHIGQGSGQGSNGQSGQDTQTGLNQSGGNTEQALLNLADVLEQNEGNQLLVEVANYSSGIKGGEAQKEKRLSSLASDEYYKRNVKEIAIRSPDYEAVKVDLGKRRAPRFISSQNVPVDQVVNLPLEQIIRFQEETGIIQLFQISDFEYRFDKYEWEEIDDLDYTYENTGLDLPDNLVFHVDSSQSMGSVQYVGTGSKYDTLMHVCYGILKTLKKASIDMKKTIHVMSANFSNGTILSNSVELNHMYDTPNNEAKKVLTGFQDGGTVYSPETFREIRKRLKPGKTAHVWITDGDLETNSAQTTLKGINETVRDPNTSFLYFEIGSQSSFGNKIRELSLQNPNVRYYPNVKIQDIQNSALEVIIQYEGGYSFSQLI